MRYTKKQEEAIFHRGNDILVSAAAGSGKTSVLSERAAQLVCEGGDIRRMLICTFTNAAAAEMRQRIVKRLSELAEESGNERLRAQSEYAAFADICTIHSFAQKIIRENVLTAEGIPTAHRVFGKDEMNLIKSRAMEECFDKLYEAEDEEFLRLRSKYSGRRDSELAVLIFSIYDYVNSLPERMDWLRAAAGNDFNYESKLKEERKESASYALALIKRCIEIDERNEWKKQADKDRSDAVYIENILKEAEDPELSRKNIESFQLARLTPRLSPEEEKDMLSALRDEIKAALADLYSFSPKAIEVESEYMRREAQGFLHVLEAFEAEYEAEKRLRKGIDFDDMMRYANELLKKDEIAEEYLSRYDYVFIDEYQDTNPVQEELLSRVSRNGGKFMVGDIKQSIYRFRLADPTIFAAKADTFEHGSGNEKLIRMNDNFRSLPGVTAPINHIMKRLMSKQFGEIDYDEREELIPGLSGEGETQLMLTIDADGEKLDAEFSSIASKILSLYGKEIDGKKLSWRDFGVLFRGGKENLIPSATEIFEKAGIPVLTETGNHASSGMLIFINVLRLLHSFDSDIALLSVMRSHIGGFDESELAQIRQLDTAGSFYSAFAKYMDGSDQLSEKCRAFRKRIEAWRIHEQALGLADFLIYLKAETNFMAAMEALPDGERAAESFLSFFNAALEMAMFVRDGAELAERLLGIYEGSGALPLAEGEVEKPDAVSLMTIHRSKGLQFPVVIIAAADKSFNEDDMRRKLIWHKQTGIAADIIDENAHLSSPSECKRIVSHIKKKESRSEELRVMYVAMTRAEKLLIISGRVKREEELKNMLLAMPSPYSLLRCRSMLAWIANGIADMPSMGGNAEDANVKIEFVRPGRFETRKEQAQKLMEDVLRQAYAMPAQEFISYDRPRIPSWVGVSWLLPEYEPIEGNYSFGEGGTAFGTLVHLFMQTADPGIRDKEAVISQIESLHRREIITEEEAQQLTSSADFIANFFKSELAERIRNSKRILRELPFCVSVPAEELGYDAPGESILVGGIIDMVFEEEDGLVIVDYKSNHASADTIFTLAEHYKRQMEMYTYAVREIWDRPIKAKYLFFLRPGIALEID